MRAKYSGVTLIELMIVVVIVAILAAIAYPSYRNSVLKSGRSDAKIALSQAAQELEKCFTRNNTYLDIPAQNKLCPYSVAVQAGMASPSAKYQVIANPIADATYTLTAHAPAGTPQAGDSDCGDYQVDQSNQRTVTGSAGLAACW